jgi:polyisoprenoid-binding protein YceI
VRKALKVGIPVAVVLLALGAFAVYWFVLRDDAPAKASLPPAPTTAAPGATASGATPPGATAPGATQQASTGGTTAAATTAQNADGAWHVTPASDVYAGYRILELFAGQAVKHTAVGRSPAVTGTITIAGNQVTAADLTVDTTKLASDESRRDNTIKRSGLETARFPSAAFKLTTPINLPGPPKVGEPVRVQAVGDLTMHGVTKPVTVTLDARWNGTTVDIAGSTPIVLADWQIQPPSIGGFVKVDDNGTLEFVVRFAR